MPTPMLTVEVTETQVAKDTIRMLDVATRLRLKGFVLSVDDFGTGLSGVQGYFIARPMTEEGLDACATQSQLRNG